MKKTTHQVCGTWFLNQGADESAVHVSWSQRSGDSARASLAPLIPGVVRQTDRVWWRRSRWLDHGSWPACGSRRLRMEGSGWRVLSCRRYPSPNGWGSLGSHFIEKGCGIQSKNVGHLRYATARFELRARCSKKVGTSMNIINMCLNIWRSKKTMYNLRG